MIALPFRIADPAEIHAQEIPILAMTANAFEEDAPPLCGGGMNVHLSKPIQMDAVIAAIARFCRKR